MCRSEYGDSMMVGSGSPVAELTGIAPAHVYSRRSRAAVTRAAGLLDIFNQYLCYVIKQSCRFGISILVACAHAASSL
jgi:hypothetical protein